jgi:hypothetical protein
LRNSFDSLRTAFQNAMRCINQLCNPEGMMKKKNTNDSSGNGNGGQSGYNQPSMNNVQDVALSNSLSNSGSPYLYQNQPNPFGTGGTKINYYLPEGTMGATIVFYDEYGNQLKEVPLNQTGNGTLNINPANLSSGIYTYSLVVNGKVVDTKKMILEK